MMRVVTIGQVPLNDRFLESRKDQAPRTLSRTPNHPNEFNLTRLCIARAEEDDPVMGAPGILEIAQSEQNLRRYRLGERSLSWRGAGCIAERIDLSFPGSLALFRGAVGQVLLGRRISEKSEQDAIWRLGFPFSDLLRRSGYLGRRRADDQCRPIEEVFEQLAHYHGEGTIHTIVLMFERANRNHDHVTWNAICRFYRRMIPDLLFYGQLSHPDIWFDCLDAIACYRNFVGVRRTSRYLNWRRELPRLKAMRKEVARIEMHWFEETYLRSLSRQARGPVFYRSGTTGRGRSEFLENSRAHSTH